MVKKLIKFALISGLFLMLVSSGSAQQMPCMPYETIKNKLLTMYHENPIGHGIAINGWLTELFLNLETRSWTIVQVQPRTMLACTRSQGRDWIVIDGNEEVNLAPGKN